MCRGVPVPERWTWGTPGRMGVTSTVSSTQTTGVTGVQGPVPVPDCGTTVEGPGTGASGVSLTQVTRPVVSRASGSPVSSFQSKIPSRQDSPPSPRVGPVPPTLRPSTPRPVRAPCPTLSPGTSALVPTLLVASVPPDLPLWNTLGRWNPCILCRIHARNSNNPWWNRIILPFSNLRRGYWYRGGLGCHGIRGVGVSRGYHCGRGLTCRVTHRDRQWRPGKDNNRGARDQG